MVEFSLTFLHSASSKIIVTLFSIKAKYFSTRLLAIFKGLDVAFGKDLMHFQAKIIALNVYSDHFVDNAYQIFKLDLN